MIRNTVANTICIIGAISSLVCGVYLIHFTATVFVKQKDIRIIELFTEVYCKEFPKWYDRERVLSTIELSFVSTGLIISYSFLVYNIKKYFKDHMILEVKSLSILFGSFMIAYTLRTFY